MAPFIAVPWCGMTGTWIGLYLKGRRLTNGEIWHLWGNCLFPNLGNGLEMTLGKTKAWNEYPCEPAGPVAANRACLTPRDTDHW